MSRRTIFLALVGFFILAVPFNSFASGSKDSTVTLKAANIHAPSQPYTMALQKWGELLEKETAGKIKIAVFPSGSIVPNQQESYAQVKNGSIDCFAFIFP